LGGKWIIIENKGGVMSELSKELGRVTEQAQAAQKKQATKEKAAETRRNNQLAKRLANESADFAEEMLPAAIEEITTSMQEAAKKGEDSFKKIWRVERGENDSLPMEELIRYEALRDMAAEYFTELGLSAECYDGRDSYVDRRGPSDDGYYPPTLTDHQVKLVVSWEPNQA
jgi:hypothetical protein